MVALEVADFRIRVIGHARKTFTDGMPDEGRLGLAVTVNATIALLHHVRVPRNLDVDQIIAVVLEINTLGRGIGREQDAHGRHIWRGLERGGDTGAFLGIKAAVQFRETFAAVTVLRENLEQPAMRGAIFREEDDARAIPLAAGTNIFLQPREDGFGLGIGTA